MGKARKPKSAVSARHNAIAKPQAAPIRILLIDDDKDFTGHQALILEKHNYSVVAAHNAASAMQLQSAFHPQLALIDLCLGPENGIDVLDALQAADRQICCLIMTGQENIDTALQSLRHGAVDYLSKSISTVELIAAIDRAAEKLWLREEKQQFETLMAASSKELSQVNQRLQEEIKVRVEAGNSALDALKELAKANELLQTRVRQQTDELISKNARYSVLAENAEDGIFIHDQQGRLFELNHSVMTNLDIS